MKAGDLVYYYPKDKPFKIGEVKGFFTKLSPYVLFFDEKHNWIVSIDKLELVNDL